MPHLRRPTHSSKPKHTLFQDRSFYESTIPTTSQISEAAKLELIGENGHRVSFGALLGSERRLSTIIIFIRHFWCPLCQDYMRSISENVDPRELKRKGVTLVIIGNGSYKMIASYRRIFQTPYPIYTDPSLALYRALGMVLSTSSGGPSSEKGTYVKHGLITGIASVVKNAARARVPFWQAGGHMEQLGGEFVFGPSGVTCFAHRMRNTRSHLPISAVCATVGVPALLPDFHSLQHIKFHRSGSPSRSNLSMYSNNTEVSTGQTFDSREQAPPVLQTHPTQGSENIREDINADLVQNYWDIINRLDDIASTCSTIERKFAPGWGSNSELTSCRNEKDTFSINSFAKFDHNPAYGDYPHSPMVPTVSDEAISGPVHFHDCNPPTVTKTMDQLHRDISRTREYTQFDCLHSSSGNSSVEFHPITASRKLPEKSTNSSQSIVVKKLSHPSIPFASLPCYGAPYKYRSRNSSQNSISTRAIYRAMENPFPSQTSMTTALSSKERQSQGRSGTISDHSNASGSQAPAKDLESSSDSPHHSSMEQDMVLEWINGVWVSRRH